jgi:hypothetical protein
MLTYSILAVIVLAAVAAIVVIVLKGKKKPTIESLESKAMKEAETMSGAEKEDLIKRLNGKSVPCTVTEHIVAQLNDLSVVHVTAYGIRYSSVKDTVERCSSLTDADALRLMTLEKEMEILRKDRFNAKRHYKAVDSVFFGKVYKYQPCVIGINTTEGKWANKPARLAVRIDRDEDGTGITEAYLATDDISKATSYVRFDFHVEADFDRFKALVLDNKDEYGAEAKMIEELIARTAKYDYLVEQGLLKIKNGRFEFSSPTKEQLEDISKIDSTIDPTVVDNEEEPETINIFENMHSSED